MLWSLIYKLVFRYLVVSFLPSPGSWRIRPSRSDSRGTSCVSVRFLFLYALEVRKLDDREVIEFLVFLSVYFSCKALEVSQN